MPLRCGFGGAYFNSRPSARGDNRGDATRKKVAIFQFTPLREGRPYALHGYSEIGRFQFTPLREGRPLFETYVKEHPHFNSRPSARGDRRCLPDAPESAYFNSRPSARGDVLRGECAETEMISIHAPPRGATALSPRCARICLFQFTPLREGRQRGDKCDA